MLRLLLLALVACAHTPNLALRPESPAPQGQEVGSFATPDGTQIFHRKWVATAPQKGVLIIQHGLRDHSDNYDHLARRAAAQGIAVWAMDLRGHARSSGPRVAPDPWHDYVEDFTQFVGIVAAAEQNQPIFLMGHSMGGAIVALTVIEKQPKQVAGLILSAPVLNLGVDPFVVGAIRMLGAIMPSLGILKLDPNSFSTNPEIGKALVKDPLVEQGDGPARTASGLADAAADIFDGIDRLTLPILALHGTVDQLTAPSGSRALIRLAPSQDKTLRIYEGFGHDLVHEPKGTQVEDDVLAWIGAHTGGPAVPPTPLYDKPLKGDPNHTLVGLQLGGGIVGPKDDLASTGLFELSLHVGKAWFPVIGWAGGLHFAASGEGVAAALMPLGVSLDGNWLGNILATYTSGISILPGRNLAIPLAVTIELSLGPIHVTPSMQLDWRITDDPPRASTLSSDLTQFGLSLRVPGDRRYWPRALAGVGPYVKGAMLSADNFETYAFQITAGLQIYGAD